MTSTLVLLLTWQVFQQQSVVCEEMMEGHVQVASWLFLMLAVSDMVSPG